MFFMQTQSESGEHLNNPRGERIDNPPGTHICMDISNSSISNMEMMNFWMKFFIQITLK